MTIWTKEKLDSLRNAVPCHWDEKSGKYLRIADTGVCVHGANKINKLQEEASELGEWLNKAIDEVQELEEKFEELQKLQERTDSSRHSWKEDSMELFRDNKKLNLEIKKLKEENAKLGMKQLVELTESYDGYGFKDQKIVELKVELKQIRTENERLKQQNKNLRINLDLAMGERELLLEESRKDFKNKKIRELNQENLNLRGECSEISEKWMNAAEKNDEISDQTSEEVLEKDYEIAVLKIENDKLKERLQFSFDVRDQLDKDYKNRIKNLEMNLDLTAGERQLLLEESREDFKDKKINELSDQNMDLLNQINDLQYEKTF